MKQRGRTNGRGVAGRDHQSRVEEELEQQRPGPRRVVGGDAFRIDIPEADLRDLRERLERARWPEAVTVEDWSQGVPLAYLRDLCRYWATGYDWRATYEANHHHHHPRGNARPTRQTTTTRAANLRGKGPRGPSAHAATRHLDPWDTAAGGPLFRGGYG